MPGDLQGTPTEGWTWGGEDDGAWLDAWLGGGYWRHGFAPTLLAEHALGRLYALSHPACPRHPVVFLAASQGAQTRPVTHGVLEADRIVVVASSPDQVFAAARQQPWMPGDPPLGPIGANDRAWAQVWLDGVCCVGLRARGPRLHGDFWRMDDYWRALPDFDGILQAMDERRFADALESMRRHASIPGVARECGCISRALGDVEGAIRYFRSAGATTDLVDALSCAGREEEARALLPDDQTLADEARRRRRADLDERLPFVISMPELGERRERLTALLDSCEGLPQLEAEVRFQLGAAWLESGEVAHATAAFAQASALDAELADRVEALTGAGGDEAGLEGLQAAIQRAEAVSDDGATAAAQAAYGLALLDAGHKTRAWAPLEAAAMSLPSSGELTAKVFAALEQLDAEGFAS